MKKFFYAAMALLMAMTASTALVACGDDDDDDINNGIDSRIVGTWNSTVSEGWDYEDGALADHWLDLNATTTRNYEIVNGKETGKYFDEDHDAEWEEVTFKADGTFTATNEDAESMSGTYSTANGKLIAKVGTDESSVDYEFKNGQLVLTSDVKGSDWREVEVSYYNKGAYVPKSK